MSVGVREYTATGSIPIATHTIGSDVYPVYEDFRTALARGQIEGHSYVHKFGAHTVGTTIAPVCQGGFYRMPQVNATVELAAISGSANDIAGGSGAREITVQYLDSSCALQTGTIAMNGDSETTRSQTV